MSKKIIISVDNKGKIEAETFGIYGSECLSELDKLLKNLSIETKTRKKDEFYKEGILINNSSKVNNS